MKKNTTTLLLVAFITIILGVLSFGGIDKILNQSPQYANYKSGDEVKGYKFALNYPSGWQVKVEDGTALLIKYGSVGSLIKRFNILLIPPGINLGKGEFGWGGFNVDVYPKQNSIEAWFSNFLSNPANGKDFNNRSYYKYTSVKIGNKTGYYIDTTDIAPNKASFSPRYIVLGNKYSYEIGFLPNGDKSSHEIIYKELFPVLVFDK